MIARTRRRAIITLSNGFVLSGVYALSRERAFLIGQLIFPLVREQLILNLLSVFLGLLILLRFILEARHKLFAASWLFNYLLFITLRVINHNLERRATHLNVVCDVRLQQDRLPDLHESAEL
jgi:hypothetical protein